MKIHFEDGQTANIELLKNEFVDYWKDILVPLEENNCRINTWNEQFFPKKKMPENIDHRDNQIKIFNDCITHLDKDFNIKFPGEMYTGQDQKWLNVIHRWVTHAAFTGGRWSLPNASIEDKIHTKWNHWKDYNWRENHDPEFEIIGDRSYFNKILFDMNCAIHEYEEFMYSPRNEELISLGYKEEDGYHLIQRYFSSDKNKHEDCYDIPNEFRKYCTYEDHDLWLPFAVLGKEYYTTWINLDDPSNFDVTNIDKTWFPGFEWQPNSYTSKVLKENIFQSWLKDHTVPTDEFIIAKLPLGHCTNKKDLDLMSSVRSPVIGVEF